ncbi:NF038132 family protein [Acidihalobacter yilgarnensis]|uniref:NF038132 family protein n=1 Tax=Acidihalobacter yilgarnensis TaxID=2819280 RepID=UPI0009F66C47|nr:NF038132 family protein [Acidihalobacter yilgarnensis]
MNSRAIKLIAAISLAIACTQAHAGIIGWTTVGNSGTSTSNDGVVAIPSGQSSVNWISTNGGVNGNNGGYGGTDGSTVTSNPFAVSTGGTALTFQFDFITSDGTSSFPDYAWANLYAVGGSNPVATLFTATTNPSGSAVPGTGAGLPSISATINPANVVINSGAGSTVWSPLGTNSGQCWGGYGNGCGNTGWVSASYNIAIPGSYVLTFGVANASDNLYDSGLAFSGAAVGGTSINNVPEPSDFALFGLSLVGMAFLRRRKQV